MLSLHITQGMVESCRVELRAEAGGLQPPYPVPGLKLSIEHVEGIEPRTEGLKGPCRPRRLSVLRAWSR